ncbi:blast:Heterogeneous nuclear ribonucleoprotein C [Drosophila guanche]|uniref:Blast:Heterogeneous nuclear ribonucleoprotein C n=1 Tax=Drosophila guanche TaxID=7266 RepID=A0A3B0JNV4_DROGU|nr:blast:Heterogeneous nuclear ribonucleoprotein C [Drosophila guanche]
MGDWRVSWSSKCPLPQLTWLSFCFTGISMHKGYAFVQFTNPFDARNACHGEDGKTVLSQTLDVNMVAEPKAHQIGRKRQNVSKTGNDWDYFYDSYCSSTLLRGGGSNGVRAKKRKRLMTNGNGLAVAVQQQQQQQHGQHHHSAAAAVAAAAAAAVHHQQQQQAQAQAQQVQHQQQQQQQQQQHHHQQQVAAVAMAAMANLLPQQQQQLLLHQQSLLSNAAATAAATTAAPGALHWSQYKQEQQQQQQQQPPQQFGFQLKSSVAVQATTSPQNAKSAIIANQTSLAEQYSGLGSGAAAGVGVGVFAHQQQQQQQQQLGCLLQPLTLALSPQQPQPLQLHSQLMQQQQQQQQQREQQQQQQREQLSLHQHLGPFKVYSNPDTLICGNCRECFGELSELLDHKKSYCKLRFTCKCQDVAFAASAKTPPSSAKLLCAVCKDAFGNPWDLMVHAQAAHMVNIYELGCDEAAGQPNANHTLNNATATASATLLADEAATKQLPPVAAVAAVASSTLNKEPNNNHKISNNNHNSSSNGHMSPTGEAIVLSASVENGTASDTETNCLADIKFSPSSSPKADQQRDDLSLDGRLSSSHSDDVHLNGKLLNGSVSSRGSSPGLETDEAPAATRACIVRTLSIETSGPTAAPAAASALSLMSNGLGLALAPQ